jgi:FixJ family two-component response regulator
LLYTIANYLIYGLVLLKAEPKLTSGARDRGDSFSISVIRRLLSKLAEHGRMKRTNLAAVTGLNYASCERYIELLRKLGWIREDIHDISGSVTTTRELICITSTGVEFNKILASDSSPSTSNHQQNAAYSLTNHPGNGLHNDAYAQQTREEGTNLEFCRQDVHSGLAPSMRPANIMLVDDDADILCTYRAFLAKQPGFSVDVFDDGLKALDRFKSVPTHYYDLVITDIRMKPLNGLQLYERMKIIDPNVRITFVSALDAVEEVVSLIPGLKSGDILRKPLNHKQFLDTIRAMIIEERQKAGQAEHVGQTRGLKIPAIERAKRDKMNPPR